MKKIICLTLCVISFLFASANDDSINNEVLSHKDSLLFEQLQVFQTQLQEPIYKLYPTTNTYNFLELNTVTGQIWLVQWSTNSSERFKYILDIEERIYSWDEKIAGRFELYPTKNIYTFILLDNIKGHCWQVQWGFEKYERFVTPIY